MRIQNDDVILGFDGFGKIQKLRCVKSDPKKTEVEVLSQENVSKNRNFKIHIAIAPTKQMERIEWFIEKAVEVGIDRISFLHTKNGIRDKVKAERVDKTILSAARQSGNYILPEWNNIEALQSFIHKNLHVEEKYVAHLGEERQYDLIDIKKGKKEYLIMIGPEGDFTPEEIELVNTVGFKSLSLGPSRLRTETAGLASCIYLNILGKLL